ncbi:MAG: cyclic nucleotide-binding domain-containing protein [Rhodocyclaceae bacterium]|nr:cyclic nucleotide-binding domain-containing protein [Rhodocyclaceae bacterium]
MSEHYQIAIVGAGPAGLSAAVRAASSGASHILLEAAPRVANTLRRYQKAKHVMAEPSALPLRSGLSFAAGPRESILRTWDEELRLSAVKRRLDSRVIAIEGARGAFRLALASGETLTAAFVVLAIGLQGNIRGLGVPGENLPRVQYQLDDPDEYKDEVIVVVGAGDAGVENALALMRRNQVILINRGECIVDCTQGNFDAVMAALGNGEIECRHDTSIERIEAAEAEGFPLRLIANTRQGVEKICCHRVIARLGADPPRQLLESFGIAFPNDDPDALPRLGAHDESSVAGLFVVGALAGYPLIKQAMNQGQDAIDRILGKPVEPVDEPALKAKLAKFRHACSVEACLAEVQRTLGLFAGLSTARLRDVLLESEIITPRAGDIVFQRNDYSSSFYSIVEGEVSARVPDWKADILLKAGDFFGEMGLISGRRRSATIIAGENCTLIETPRRTMLKLLSIESVRRRIDQVAIRRAIHRYVGLFLDEDELDHLVRRARIKRCEAGEVLFREGDKADGLYLIRRGSVTVSRMIGGREVVLSYVAAGSYVGEMALVSGKPRYATVRAVGGAEVIVLDAEQVVWLKSRHPNMRHRMDERYFDFMQAGEEEHRLAGLTEVSGAQPDNLIAFLMRQGIGEATDVLLIDLSLCIRCDNCEAACADTHQGASRLNREAGSALGAIHVPASCRHCEHPHCMKDCPPDAIHRSPGGEVFIDDSCIGCGNCKTHCPYDVIQIAPINPGYRPRAWWRALFGADGASPARQDHAGLPVKAVKCDMCKDLAAGPACTRACPTGAALRVGPEDFLEYARQKVGAVAPSSLGG